MHLLKYFCKYTYDIHSIYLLIFSHRHVSNFPHSIYYDLCMLCIYVLFSMVSFGIYTSVEINTMFCSVLLMANQDKTKSDVGIVLIKKLFSSLVILVTHN